MQHVWQPVKIASNPRRTGVMDVAVFDMATRTPETPLPLDDSLLYEAELMVRAGERHATNYDAVFLTNVTSQYDPNGYLAALAKEVSEDPTSFSEDAHIPIWSQVFSLLKEDNGFRDAVTWNQIRRAICDLENRFDADEDWGAIIQHVADRCLFSRKFAERVIYHALDESCGNTDFLSNSSSECEWDYDQDAAYPSLATAWRRYKSKNRNRFPISLGISHHTLEFHFDRSAEGLVLSKIAYRQSLPTDDIDVQAFIA